MNSSKNRCVLVVGAGPVGLAAALELARLKHPVRIIEKKAAPSTQSKAIGINARTLELMEPSSVTEMLLKRGLKIPRINFLNEERLIFQIEFSKVRHRYNFMLGLPQSETERTIEKKLKLLGIEVERNVELINFEQSGESVRCFLSDSGNEMEFNAHLLNRC